MALAREDGLGVELLALDGMAAMSQANDLPVVRARGDLEVGGQARLEHDQRVVARRLEPRRQAPEDAVAVVRDRGGLPVHLPLRSRDRAPEGLADRLMAEADAEDRHAGVEAADQLERDAGTVRIAGTR